MNKIDIYIVCSSCNLSRKKPYLWLKEKHLPCPGCGTEVTINDSHIRIVDMQMSDALKEIGNSLYTTKTIELKV